jgi:hypothetical protein
MTTTFPQYLLKLSVMFCLNYLNKIRVFIENLEVVKGTVTTWQCSAIFFILETFGANDLTAAAWNSKGFLLFNCLHTILLIAFACQHSSPRGIFPPFLSKSLAPKESGAVTAAGWNSEGQLGVGRDTECTSLPLAVPGIFVKEFVIKKLSF